MHRTQLAVQWALAEAGAAKDKGQQHWVLRGQSSSGDWQWAGVTPRAERNTGLLTINMSRTQQ